MCRTGGRRCEARWDTAHTTRALTRRRVTRNQQRAATARATGDDPLARYYDSLAQNAHALAEHYDAQITAHTAGEQPPSAAVGERPRDYQLAAPAPRFDPAHPDSGARPVTDLTAAGWPPDVYENPRAHGVRFEETAQQLTRIHQDPQVTLTVYRAVPAEHQELNNGDWVTLSRDHARQIARRNGRGVPTVVVSREVPADHVLASNDSLDDWGYAGPSVATPTRPHRTRAQKAAAAAAAQEQAHTTSPGTAGVPAESQRADLAATHSPAQHPLASEPTEPMDFSYIRNPVSSTTHVTGNDYGQDIEPAGRYMSLSEGHCPPGWESGTVTFQQPLHLDWGPDAEYSHPENWKHRLSQHYDGKTGKKLSRALRSDGYDAIITHDKYGVSETIDLTGI